VAPPKRKSGGRTTPKGTKPGQLPTAGGRPIGATGGGPTRAGEVEASSRYTPPIPREFRESPRWVPILMFSLFIIGALIIMLFYLGAVPGGRSNWYLVVGLGFILSGLFTATKYR
jgi:hypothetical protein